MKSYIVYECENCGKTSKNKEDIIRCEASHINVSLETMLMWKTLQQKVKYFSSAMLNHCNDQTRFDYDNAVEQLVAFEKENNIKA